MARLTTGLNTVASRRVDNLLDDLCPQLVGKVSVGDIARVMDVTEKRARQWLLRFNDVDQEYVESAVEQIVEMVFPSPPSMRPVSSSTESKRPDACGRCQGYMTAELDGYYCVICGWRQ